MECDDAMEEFTVRPCHEHELVAWGDLCARGFAHRPGAPDRFYRKYLVDPTARPSWVRVVVASSGALVGSVRVFGRQIHAGGKVLPCAGLGEVCTDPAYRGKGISTMMLVDAVQFAEHETGAVFSALHAAEGVRPLYARFGYQALNVPYSAVSVDGLFTSLGCAGHAPAPLRGVPCATIGGRRVVAHRVDCARDCEELTRLHAEYMQKLGVTGYTHRTKDYWRRWMPHITNGNIWALRVLTDAPTPLSTGAYDAGHGARRPDFGANTSLQIALPDGESPMSDCSESSPTAGYLSSTSSASASSPHGGPIIAYACVLRKGDAYKLADFAASPDATSAMCRWLIAHTASSVIDADIAAGAVRDDDRTINQIIGPSAALEPLLADMPAAHRKESHRHEAADDTGWMVRPLGARVKPDPGIVAMGESNGDLSAPFTPNEAIDALQRASEAGRYLVWMVDFF